MAKLKLLYIITGLDPGGAEKVLFDLCTNIDDKQFDIYLIVLSTKTKLLHKFQKAGIHTTALAMQKNLLDFIKTLVNVSRAIKQNKIQIVHAHMVHSMIFSAFLKIFNPGLQIVFTPHSIRIGNKFRELILFLLKPFRSIDILFSEEQFRYFFKKDYRIIPNGIKVERAKKLPAKFEPFTFLAVGRLERVKNHSALIAFAEILKGKVDFQILIAGTGPLRKSLDKMILSVGVQEQVKLLGFREDILALCRKAHVFLMPSLWEGLPVSILEAGSAKLPIISTPVGSIPSLIDDSTGYLTAIGSFADQMEEIMKDYRSAQIKAEHLYEKIIGEYSLDSMIKKHQKLYKSLIKGSN